MKKWLMLLMLVIVLTSLLSAATVKVAILPLKKLDSGSQYIKKILTVRDLKLTFNKHDKYDLMDMKQVERDFKDFDILDIDDMQIEDMETVASGLKVDLLVLGTISSRSQDQFQITMRIFSSRTKEIKSITFEVGKEKKKRWEVLDTVFMKDMDIFFSREIEKMGNIALNYYMSENYVEAEKAYKSILTFDPNNKDAYFYLGKTYLKLHKYDLAIQNINKVIAVDANNIQAIQALIDIYKETKQDDLMLANLEKLANLTKDEELWLSIGNLYAEKNNSLKAIEAFQNSLAIDPNYAMAQYRLAFLYYDQGKYNDAISYLEFAANQFPDNDLIGRRLAVCYQKTGRIMEAIAKYEASIKTNPNNTQAYLNVTGLYRTAAADVTDPKIAAGYYQKAIETMNNLKKIEPNNALIYLNLASIYLAQNKNKDAEINATLAKDKDPSLYQSYIILATITQANGTDKYNQFVDLEKQASKAVGKKATSLGKDRDAAKNAALTYFAKADELLKLAKSKATEQEAITDINNKLAGLARIMSQLKGY